MSSPRWPARRASLVLLLLALAGAPLRAETPEEIFSRGNAAYEQEQFGKAAEAYEMLIRYKIRDARVEYNLGNAQFRLGNLGQAILRYERARRLAPTDPDILANLEHARSFCFDRVDPPEQPAALAWLFALQDRLGPDRQAWFGLGLVWLLAGVLGWGLARPGRWSPRYGWTLAVGLLCLALVAVSWQATFTRLEGRRLAVVLEESVEVLAGPGENNPTLFTVHEGLTIEVRDERQEWVQVSLPNGLNGWLARDALGLV